MYNFLVTGKAEQHTGPAPSEVGQPPGGQNKAQKRSVSEFRVAQMFLTAANTHSADFQKCPGWESRRFSFGSFSSMSMRTVKLGLSLRSNDQHADRISCKGNRIPLTAQLCTPSKRLSSATRASPAGAPTERPTSLQPRTVPQAPGRPFLHNRYVQRLSV